MRVITDQAWNDNLRWIRNVLHQQGNLVFEVRDPAREAWTEWTREKTFRRLFVPSRGYVQGWCEVTQVVGNLVSFRWKYLFESDGEELTSDSTIRFRTRGAIESSLIEANYQAARFETLQTGRDERWFLYALWRK